MLLLLPTWDPQVGARFISPILPIRLDDTFLASILTSLRRVYSRHYECNDSCGHRENGELCDELDLD